MVQACKCSYSGIEAEVSKVWYGWKKTLKLLDSMESKYSNRGDSKRCTIIQHTNSKSKKMEIATPVPFLGP